MNNGIGMPQFAFKPTILLEKKIKWHLKCGKKEHLNAFLRLENRNASNAKI
jgi:hypothetical protein